VLGVLEMAKACGSLHRGKIPLKGLEALLLRERGGGVSKRVISVTSPRIWSGGPVFRGVGDYKKE
jgi:hypothetical protein